MTRVLYLTQGLGVGGTEKQLLYLLQALDRSRFTPTLAVFRAKGALRPAFEAANVPIMDLGLQQPLSHPRNAPALWRFVQWLRAEQFAIVHSWLYHPNIVGVACGRLAGTRQIIVSERNLGYFHKTFHRLLARVTYPFAACVTTNSTPSGKVLLKNKLTSVQKLVVIPNGIALPAIPCSAQDVVAARRSFGLPSTGPVVATTGRFAPVKGHAHLVAACALVTQEFPSVTFALAGEGEGRDALQKQAVSLGIDSHIRFVGHVENPAAFLAGVDVFVLPSLSEGMSNALMEAMAMARPIVATAVGGNCELIEHNQSGLLVPPADPPALAQAIGALLGDPQRARSLAQSARSKIESYSLESMVARTTELYERVLHGAR